MGRSVLLWRPVERPTEPHSARSTPFKLRRVPWGWSTDEGVETTSTRASSGTGQGRGSV